jgi:hypothetical protein
LLAVIHAISRIDATTEPAMGHATHLASQAGLRRGQRHVAADDDGGLGDAAALALAAHATLRELQLAAAQKEADKEAREEQLERRRKTTAPVPAMEAMTREELAPARPRQPKEMLEIWRTSSERAGHRGIERSAHRGEEHDCGDARADLEAAVGDITVRHPIADEVEEQSEWQRAEPRTDERAAGSTGCNVKGDDQAASLASRLARPLSVAPRRKTAERVTV